MDLLFSCRNCTHNSGQSLNIGRGHGFCLHHDSIITRPDRTTCKYLYRKDMPWFTVDEGVAEHAAEFAAISGMAGLYDHAPLVPVRYSERFYWEKRAFDSLTHALAQYSKKAEPSWVFVQGMTGGLDGRRALNHCCLVRRYMNRCGTWKSSYRLILAVIQELDQESLFAERDLNLSEEDNESEVRFDALWDVFFCRLSGVQEYGFHAGIGELMWATDSLNGALVEFDWSSLSRELQKKRHEWTEIVIGHAEMEGEFFPDSTGPDEDPRM